MINNKRILAIIPARGGSKRIKNKNIRDICGKPLIQYTTEAAQASKYIDKLVVSTENEQIKKVVGHSICLNRSLNLASDTATTESVMLDVCSQVEEKFDILILLQCTSPLRNEEDIDSALERFISLEYDSLLSVNEEKGFIWVDSKPINYNPFTSEGRPRFQELKAHFKENGAIYIIKYPLFLEKKSRLAGNIGFYVMPEETSLEIDHRQDIRKLKNQLGKTKRPDGKRVFTIAEMGCNHQGDTDIAKEMIDVAAWCGVDAIKGQKRSLSCIPNPDRPYLGENSFDTTYLEHRKYLELSIEDHLELKEYAEKKGLTYFVSVWDIKSVQEVFDILDPKIIKIPSAKLTDTELIKAIINRSDKYLDIVLSTGMSTIQEIDSAIGFFNSLKNFYNQLYILQCTSNYPLSFDEIALPVLNQYRERYGFPVGYSGHHIGCAIDNAAVALGAVILERHFTLNKTWKGTDHAASLEPDELKKWIEGIRQTEQALKIKEKIVFDSEIPHRNKLRGI